MNLNEDTRFDQEDALVNEINMVPMIDVMLVLLILFIITLPVINHAVKVELPKAETQPLEQQEQGIDVSVLANGEILWHGEPVDDAALQARILAAAAEDPAPALRIHADKEVRYERLAYLMSRAQRGGLSKLDFVTEPEPEA